MIIESVEDKTIKKAKKINRKIKGSCKNIFFGKTWPLKIAATQQMEIQIANRIICSIIKHLI